MPNVIAGGCLCGAVRYRIEGAPIYAGLCYCRDCQKESGSAFIPFMGLPASAITFTGETKRTIAKSIRGSDAVRNHCRHCSSLVYGGIVGTDKEHTIYAGTLDDFSVFKPTMAIFTRHRPEWSALPEGVTAFETMPGVPH